MFKKDSVEGQLRHLEIGESVLFPYEKRSAARTAASTLKREWGVFFVTKTESAGVRVTRVPPDQHTAITEVALSRNGFLPKEHGVYCRKGENYTLRYSFMTYRLEFEYYRKPGFPKEYGSIEIHYLNEFQWLLDLLDMRIRLK